MCQLAGWRTVRSAFVVSTSTRIQTTRGQACPPHDVADLLTNSQHAALFSTHCSSAAPTTQFAYLGGGASTAQRLDDSDSSMADMTGRLTRRLFSTQCKSKGPLQQAAGGYLVTPTVSLSAPLHCIHSAAAMEVDGIDVKSCSQSIQPSTFVASILHLI